MVFTQISTMIEIKVLDLDINEISYIVGELKNKGYKLNTDFDFAYHPPKFDNFSGDAVYNKHVLFTFYKEELATYFTLKYL